MFGGSVVGRAVAVAIAIAGFFVGCEHDGEGDDDGDSDGEGEGEGNRGQLAIARLFLPSTVLRNNALLESREVVRIARERPSSI